MFREFLKTQLLEIFPDRKFYGRTRFTRSIRATLIAKDFANGAPSANNHGNDVSYRAEVFAVRAHLPTASLILREKYPKRKRNGKRVDLERINQNVPVRRYCLIFMHDAYFSISRGNLINAAGRALLCYKMARVHAFNAR